MDRQQPAGSADSARSRGATLWIAALCGGVLVLHAAWFWFFRLDDAFVLLRYAQNVRAGLGWVFNPGEHVEGFTSPAMVAFDAVALGLGADGLTAAKILGLVAGFLAVAGTVRLARDLEATPASQLLAATTVSLSMPLAVGCVNGLETAPFAAACVWGLALSQSAEQRERVLSGIVLALAVLLRPDGVLAFACVFFPTDVRWPNPGRERWRWLDRAVPWAGLVVPVTLWRGLTFGSLASNTYFAKVAPHAMNRWQSGLDYLVRFGAVPALLLGAIGLMALAVDRPRARVLLLFVAIWCVYVVATGGDWIPRGRFLVPIIPVLAAGLGAAASRLGDWLFAQRRSPRAWTVGLATLTVAAQVPRALADSRETRAQIATLTDASVSGRGRLGRWLHRAGAPGDSVALFDVGEIGYESGLDVIDTGGLTDRSIAHLLHKSGGTYYGYLFFPDDETSARIVRDVLARKPDMVVNVLNGPLPALMANRSPLKAAYRQDIAMMRDPVFKAGYEYLCSVPGEAQVDGTRFAYNLFIRKGYRPRISPAPAAPGDALCDG
jgi:hypothetical protein